jgi:hypothetical protein
MKLPSAPQFRSIAVSIFTLFLSVSAHATPGVSAFAFDRHTGQNTVCKSFSSSSEAESCAINWCRAQSIDRTNCGIVHCVFQGWNAIALGQDIDVNGRHYYHAGSGCGSQTKLEAKALAMSRCEADHSAICELTSLFFID